MKEKYRITHYMPLVAIVTASIIGYCLFQYDSNLRIAITVATGVSYFVWGIVHHYIHKNLSFEIVIEYLVISIFGVSAVLTVIR